jgi:transcriptional regulator
MQDWTRAQAYAYTQALSAREWAWEFLRRNPQFRVAWQRSSLMATPQNEASTASLAIPAALSTWGVLFRRLSRRCCAQCPRPLGPRGVLYCLPRNGRGGPQWRHLSSGPRIPVCGPAHARRNPTRCDSELRSNPSARRGRCRHKSPSQYHSDYSGPGTTVCSAPIDGQVPQ